jgi:hypothetical protein
VRYVVAQKVAPTALKALENDPEPDVRSIVQQRLSSISQVDDYHD